MDENSEDFEVDKYALDEEWVKQPKRVFDYSKKLADANLELERAKRELKVVDAELKAAIRKDPEEYGLAKITEDGLASAVVLQRRHTKASDKVMEAEHMVDLLKGAIVALDNKKKSLENLVHLHSVSYFAEPKAPREARENVGDMKRERAFTKKKA